MKSIASKIGKVALVMKRNGFLGGGRIISCYLATYAKAFFVGSGDVLFISSGVGDSAYYRAYNPAEELRIHGFKCSTTISDNPNLLKLVDKFSVFIFCRVAVDSMVEKMIKKIKEQQKEIIFDTDDLVFDAKLFHETDSYKSMNSLMKHQYEKGIGEEIIKDSYVKVCTTSTSYLADILKKYDKKVFIVKDKISNRELALSEKIINDLPKEKNGFIKIGYFSGTYSHNKDFATITDALMEILEKYADARLYLAGPLDTESRLNRFKEKIVTMPFVPRDKYYENIWKVDINLAPLVKNEPFCESKFEIKFMEPGLLKIPTVAVNNQTFSEAIEDGIDGFLADNTSEWIGKISRLIEDENLRISMGEKAREKVLREYTNKNSHNKEYYNFLNDKIKV